MLIYLAAPYSNVSDRHALLKQVMTYSGRHMVAHPGEHIVSPLFNHFSLDVCPDLGHDWQFWKRYSIDLMKRCDKLIVLTMDGWKSSTGVSAEIELATVLNMPIYYRSLA